MKSKEAIGLALSPANLLEKAIRRKKLLAVTIYGWVVTPPMSSLQGCHDSMKSPQVFSLYTFDVNTDRIGLTHLPQSVDLLVLPVPMAMTVMQHQPGPT